MPGIPASATASRPRPLSVAILGGGVDSAIGRAHQAALSIDARYTLAAGCFSRDEEINRRSAAAYGVPNDRLYPSVDACLAAERATVDAALVLTPTDQHTGHGIASLDAGLPVICEKAVSTTSAELLQIADTLERYRGYLAVTYNYLGNPMLRELRT